MQQEKVDLCPPPNRRAARSDSRAECCTATVLLVGKIHDGRTTTACLVLNLSEVGLMARITFFAEVGQRIAVEMRGMPLASATIRWVNGNRVGLEFDYRQNLNPVFCLMSDDGRVARAPRFSVQLKAVLRVDGHGVPVHVANISPGGVRLSAGHPVQPGQTGEIVVPGYDLCLFGSVKWVENGEFGFHFATPQPLGALSSYLQD